MFLHATAFAHLRTSCKSGTIKVIDPEHKVAKAAAYVLLVLLRLRKMFVCAVSQDVLKAARGWRACGIDRSVWIFILAHGCLLALLLLSDSDLARHATGIQPPLCHTHSLLPKDAVGGPSLRDLRD